MAHSKRFLTANDNAPVRAYPLAVNKRFAAVPQPEPTEFSTRIEFAHPPVQQNDVAETSDKKTPYKTAGLVALVAITCALMLSSSKIGLSFTDCIGVLAGGSVAFAALAKSRIALLMSVTASLLWAGYSFTSPTAQSVLFFAFPAIWSMQIYLASHLKSRLAIIFGNIAGYYWLIGHGLVFMAAGVISPTMALSALFMAGIVHYRGGKAAEDEGAFGHETHTYFGWIFAMIGAVFISHYWLFSDNVLWQNMKASAMGTLGWKIALAMGVTATALSMMVRWKHYRISALAAAILTVICALTPASLWWEAPLRSMFETVLNFAAVPTIGILIAAGTLTSALAVAVNGVRRNRLMMIVTGLLGGGAQGLLLANPALMTFENIVIFIIAMTFAICATGMLAQNSLAQNRPA